MSLMWADVLAFEAALNVYVGEPIVWKTTPRVVALTVFWRWRTLPNGCLRRPKHRMRARRERGGF